MNGIIIKNKVYELAEVESDAIAICEQCALFDICGNPICVGLMSVLKKRNIKIDIDKAMFKLKK